MTLPEKLNKRQRDAVDNWKMLGWDKTMPAEYEKHILSLGTTENIRQKIKADKAERIVREAETVAYSLNNLGELIEQRCKNCSRRYLSTYRYNRHCSMECLQITIEAMGIEFDSAKTEEERYRAEPPGIIRPDTLKVLKKWARQLLALEDQQTDYPVPRPPPVPLLATKTDAVPELMPPPPGEFDNWLIDL